MCEANLEARGRKERERWELGRKERCKDENDAT